jgi:WD40 repeat protein
MGRQSDGSVCSLACSPDGKRLISRSSQSVYVWEPSSRRLLHRFERGASTDVPPATDGEYLYEERNGDVVQRELATGEIVRTIVSHGKVMVLEVDANGRHLASVGYDQRLCLVDIPSGKLVWEALHPAGIGGANRFLTPTLAFGPQGTIATASCAGDPTSWTIHLWQNGRELISFKGHSDFVFGAAFAGDRQLFSWSGDGDLRRSDLPMLDTLKGHP